MIPAKACVFSMLLATIALNSTAKGQGLIGRIRGGQDALAESISIKQLAGLIDGLDEDLYDYGKIVVKGPDVWGQNRMTPYRQEFEKQMKGQLDTFELILNSYQRRSDAAALTSATTIAAAIQPRVSNSRNVTTNTTTVTQPTISDPSSLVANANTLIGSASPLLSPSNLTALSLSNAGARQGIGLEPTIALDERARFINHLQQLRRINAGDDRTDLPGYGLYLVRIPVSILPDEESIRGKGATITVQAKLDLTPDLLANTFRNVVILDTAYQLMDLVTRGQYVKLQEEIHDCGDPVACETKAIPQLPGQGLLVLQL